MNNHQNGASRPVIENAKPEISGGRFPIKRIIGDELRVESTIFVDGHDLLAAAVLYRHEGERDWSVAPMVDTKKRDIWTASIPMEKLGLYHYTVEAWIDRFGTWRHDLLKRFEAKQDTTMDFRVGVRILAQAAKAAARARQTADRAKLEQAGKLLANAAIGKASADRAVKLMTSAPFDALVRRYPDKTHCVRHDRELEAIVERERARFSAWYEFFPRSASGKHGKHGTFRDCEKMLPYVAGMGFDVVYFPPIHPIGFQHRKGRNNSLMAGSSDPGSPWGIGAAEGGHKAVHPELGTLADFKRLLHKTHSLGMEIAIDLAYQCSPDHPYVKAHPEWFRKRPDGTIQYAENPPKKYQDIYPFDFETEAWQELWQELKNVVTFWARNGVRIFRVDNPHTKSVRFWRWMIREIKKEFPDTIFLAEAFTKPSMMYHLAKIGFGQSYTYFTWRNTKKEFQDYLTELTKTEVAEYYRPNFWPNTPDILPAHLQTGGRPAFIARLALAATLSANYGIYGPSYELGDNQPMHENSEEYLNSEKYEIRTWDLKAKHSISKYIARINRIRRQNRALRDNANIRFHPTTNDQVLCYTKHTDDLSNFVLVVANLDFKNKQTATVDLPVDLLGVASGKTLRAIDLLNGTKTGWKGKQKQLTLDPNTLPVAIFRLEVTR